LLLIFEGLVLGETKFVALTAMAKVVVVVGLILVGLILVGLILVGLILVG
jgi:amino acid permease